MSRKIAIEQHFILDLMRMHRHTHRLIGPLDRRQRDAGPARTENDRRHDHVQAVETAGREEARHGVGTTFDQYPPQPARTKCCKNGRRGKVSVGGGQTKELDSLDRGSGFSFCSYQDAPDAILDENLRLVAETAAGIDDHARRLPPGDPAYGQLRIVGYRSTDADDDGVHQSPQSVEVGQSGRPIDVFRMPRFCRNAAIERLADLADHHELINKTAAKRAENFAPGLWQRLVTRPENIAKLQPRIG